ncbi:predicted protein [Postia placenta Mad-698-R]|uniref:Uncharacterized protein n=1 Tax=Postia placenta MAD-698-R-SB12 TaxID=670580 RepID=A0A1X6N2T6_9APHY|nr:hypothetical protein POSPLADRAFT_1141214 [Postia placenta MAD-698-R-SB12]EED81994.1 predicted protein [Postia placenta Mad-698-R]OSX62904.1 hypothetical protein POSPLADRAFT_1141214 [Postia placenta MAD-698-R-SB12]
MVAEPQKLPDADASSFLRGRARGNQRSQAVVTGPSWILPTRNDAGYPRTSLFASQPLSVSINGGVQTCTCLYCLQKFSHQSPQRGGDLRSNDGRSAINKLSEKQSKSRTLRAVTLHCHFLDTSLFSTLSSLEHLTDLSIEFGYTRGEVVGTSPWAFPSLTLISLTSAGEIRHIAQLVNSVSSPDLESLERQDNAVTSGASQDGWRECASARRHGVPPAVPWLEALWLPKVAQRSGPLAALPPVTSPRLKTLDLEQWDSDDNDSDGDNGGSSHVDLGARFDPHMMRVDDAGDISNAELMTSLSSVESDSEDEDVSDTLSEDGTDLGTENDVGQEAAAECTWEGFCVD